jgi:hypothetical protein
MKNVGVKFASLCTGKAPSLGNFIMYANKFAGLRKALLALDIF